MTAILRQMSDDHYTQYILHFGHNSDLMDFLMEILMTFRDLVTNNVFPSDWNDMIMLQNSVFLKALRHFSHTIQDRFSQQFEIEVSILIWYSCACLASFTLKQTPELSLTYFGPPHLSQLLQQ